MKKKILFFDFDGTISDAKDLADESLINTLKSYGFNFDRRRAKKMLGSKMPEIFKKLGIKFPFINRFRERFYRRMIFGVKEGKIKLCVSVKPLEELKREGYKLIIVSNSETRFIKISIKRLGLKKLFYRVYGAEKFSTKDKLLKRLFKKFKINEKEAIYVGDRFSDIKYANLAGCISVAIHNKCSWSSKKDVMKEKPDFVIEDFYGLKKILKD